jgi:NAD(P)H-nitrite reductase large subunit
MPRRHVLIGGGPGAIAAAESIRRADDDAEIVLVNRDAHGYYSRPGLAYHLAGELPEKGLFPVAPRDLAALHVEVVRERAVALDPARHRATLESGRELPYDRLLLATGSRAVPAKVPGAELAGVVKLDDLDDARDIIRRCRTATAAVVVGGGITALEIVEGLAAQGVRVEYLMRQDRYWRNVLSEAESRLVERRLAQEGVRLRHHTELAGILGRDGRVAGVETDDGTRIPCDLVAVAVGVRPRVELATTAGLECGRGVLVDAYLRSSVDDIFAAGDIAETRDAETGRGTLDVLWNSAVAKGRVAGLNMATRPLHTYEKGASLNITRLAGHKTTIIGTVGNGEDADLQALARGDSQSWSELGPATLVAARSGGARVRLELGEGTILGAVVMGDQALSFPLQELVGARADVSAIAQSLREREAAVADIVTAFWRDWAAQHA